MFPVLADQEIFIIQMRRQERLAKAERDRMVKSLAVATDALPWLTTARRRVWAGLGRGSGLLTRCRVARTAHIGAEVGAIPSA